MKQQFVLGWSKTQEKLYWLDKETGLRCDEIPDGIGSSDVGDWLYCWSRSNGRHYWVNYRTGEKSDTEMCPPKATRASIQGTNCPGSSEHCIDIDGLHQGDYPKDHRLHRQHPMFDERATKRWREWNKHHTEEINDGPITKKRNEEVESTNGMAEETKENRGIANRDRVRKCRAKKNSGRKAVAKLQNTLGKRLLRQKEKRPFNYCDMQLDELNEKKKAKASQEMRIYRSKLSAEKKDEMKKQNTKRKAELRKLEKERETSEERTDRLDWQAYTTRKSVVKIMHGNNKEAIAKYASKDYYVYKNGCD